MTSAGEEFAPRRILVALDASACSLAALEAASDLAARLQADLLGLFVEDINLVRAGGLDSTRHVSLPSGAGEPLDAGAVEAQFRIVAAEARAALQAAAERVGVRGAFRVVRGSVAVEVLAAASDADLLILGWASRPLGRRPRMGGTAWAAARRSPGSVLLLPPGGALAGPVLVFLGEGELLPPALPAASRVAQVLRSSVTVVTTARSAEAARERGRRAEDWLAGRGVAAHSRPGAESAGSLRSALRAEKTGIVVVAARSPLLQDGLRELLEDIACPVLLAR